jgi:hypothetical protein
MLLPALLHIVHIPVSIQDNMFADIFYTIHTWRSFLFLLRCFVLFDVSLNMRALFRKENMKIGSIIWRAFFCGCQD